MSDDTSIYGKTAREWLRRWDAGESVWSLEMGGLGPGYEQCIQVAAMEVVRDMLDRPTPKEGDAQEYKAWSELADVALHRADKFPGMGMSGAQAGAAKSIALKMLRCGPEAFFAKVKKERPDRAADMIQVSRDFPNPPVAVKP